ncbi:MAG TPA: preprotein translocase subunit SecG [Blastocatellia bacterium]|nr:preprotein translocase subunit SecG [Blastocatellia bacterium]
MLGYILTILYVLACFILILFVLLQPGKADASAVFGGGVNSAAFGPRGTQTVLAKVTIGAAIVFFMIAFLFSIPGLFEKRSLGESSSAESAPAPISTPVPAEPSPTPASGAANEQTNPNPPATNSNAAAKTSNQKEGSNAAPAKAGNAGQKNSNK